MLGAIGQIPGMAQAGLGVPWYGLNQLAGILGSPTVLGGGGGSQSTNWGESFNASGSVSNAEQFSGDQEFVEENMPGYVPPEEETGSGFNGNGSIK